MTDQSKPTPPFRLFRPPSPPAALGLAVSHLMTKPAFANLKFGEWSKILTGQVNRGHYCFVADANEKIQGFAGWAITTRDKAELWVTGRGILAYEDCFAGDCLVYNAWSANSFAVHRFMVDEGRKLINGKATMYFKRHYPDGSTRPVRLNVNGYVKDHISHRDEAGRDWTKFNS